MSSCGMMGNNKALQAMCAVTRPLPRRREQTLPRRGGRRRARIAAESCVRHGDLRSRLGTGFPILALSHISRTGDALAPDLPQEGALRAVLEQLKSRAFRSAPPT